MFVMSISTEAMGNVGSSLTDPYEEKFMASVREKAQALQDAANKHLEIALTAKCPQWRSMDRSRLAARLRSEVLVGPDEVRYYFDGELFFSHRRPRVTLDSRQSDTLYIRSATISGGHC